MSTTNPENPKDIFTSADNLFDDVDYQRGYRKIQGTLDDKYDRPLVPIWIQDILGENQQRTVVLNLFYLLSDGSRVDQAVKYTLKEGEDTPIVDQNVNFGDTWGSDIPHEPFFAEPQPPLTIMRKAIDTVREQRLETNPEYRNQVWRLG